MGDKAKCSVTLNLQFNRGDADACHRLDLISNRAFLDPMLRGRYPDELFSITKGICDWDFIQSGDLELIHQPIDVLGINYYSTNRVAMSDRPQFPQSTEASTAPGASDVDWLSTEGPHTDMAGTSIRTACMTCWCACTTTIRRSIWWSPRTAWPARTS